MRRYIGYFREEVLLDRLRSVLADVKVHNFKVLNLEPHSKDGGVFVRFRYNAGSDDAALSEVVHSLRQHTAEHGGVPSWAGLSGGNVWLVKGKPWREVCSLALVVQEVDTLTYIFQDMNRYASPILRVAFEGPDVPEESLYDLLRVCPTCYFITRIPTEVPLAVWSNTGSLPPNASSCSRRPALFDCHLPWSPLCRHRSQCCTRCTRRALRHDYTYNIPGACAGPCRPRLYGQSSTHILTGASVLARHHYLYREWTLLRSGAYSYSYSLDIRPCPCIHGGG